MFDMSKTVSFKGKIKELQWTNPHVWIELTVDEKDGPVTYAFEGAAVAVLKRVGWTKDSVKAGDVVTVVGHPYKNGRPGGSIDHLDARRWAQARHGRCDPGRAARAGRPVTDGETRGHHELDGITYLARRSRPAWRRLAFRR